MKNILRPIFLRFLGFASIFQGILLFGNWVIFSTIVHLFDVQNPYGIEALRWGFLILAWSFIPAWLLAMQKFSQARNWFYYTVAVYLGLGYFLVFASAIFWLLEIFKLVFGFSWQTLTIGKIFLVVGLLVGFYGIWNSYKIKVKTYKIKLPNLPQYWRGKKIVMFADSHLGNIRGTGFAKKIAHTVNLQEPEMVLIPGDYFDGPPADYEQLAAPLSQIRTRHGVYFSTGNHEEFRKNDPYLEALSKAGVIILNNSFTEVEGLQILGVDFQSTRGNRKFGRILRNINFDRNKPSILLKHVPSSLTAALEANVNLMLSGHTHRAQVFPFGFLTKMIFKGYDYGLKPFGSMQVLTTSGVGTWGPPQRVGTSSEIVVIILE